MVEPALDGGVENTADMRTNVLDVHPDVPPEIHVAVP
jgi:hypothetical protein